MHGALEEFRLVEQQVEMSGREELWILEAVDVIDVLVEDAQRQDGQRCVKQIVDRDEHWIKHGLSTSTNRVDSNKATPTVTNRKY